MKKILSLAILASCLSSCSKYGNVSLQFPTAPVVEFPSDIKSIALVNRSGTDAASNGRTIAEAILSGEVAGSDKKASSSCLRGVYDKMNGWHQINIVHLEKRKLIGTGNRQISELVDWTTVKHLCDSTKTDALLVLENFDSNSDATVNSAGNILNKLAGAPSAPVTAPVSQIRMNVECYWRLYNPKTQQVVDQYRSQSHLLFTPGLLGIAVPPPEALSKTAYQAGEEYVQRFFPVYNNVQRLIYKKGKRPQKDAFKTAFRKTEVANWQGAIDVWNETLKNTSSAKNAGRLCLNIAVAYEVLGDVKQAQVWVKKSYEDYGNKRARDYSNQLSYRAQYEY